MILKKILYVFLFVFISISGQLIAQSNWNSTNGPKDELGNFKIVYSLDTTNGSIFAGTEQGGLFKSTNSGGSWVKIWNVTYKIWTVKQQPTTGYIFVGTDGNGLFRSTNGGASFTSVFEQGVNNWIASIAFDPAGNIFIGTDIEAGGLYYSSDNGSNWTLKWNASYIPISMAFKAPNDIFVATMLNGVYKSTDSGGSWNQKGFLGEFVWSLIIDQQDNIYAGIEGSGIFKSTDYCDNWENISGQSVTSVTANIIKNSKDYLFVVNDLNVVYKSKDEGQNWENITEGLENNFLNYIAIDDYGFLYAGTYEGGVYKTAQSTFPAELFNTTINGTTFCAGTNIDVKFSMEGTFESDNEFTAQISDALGSFSNPTNIGSLKAVSGTSISSILPVDIASGLGYRIRVIASNPVKTANQNNTNLQINSLETTLSLPENNSVDVDLKASFSWLANNCAASYTLEISKLQDFSLVDITKVVNTNSFTLLNNLENNTSYWWRIGVKTTDGLQKFSQPFSFKTKNQTTFTQTINLEQGWNTISTYIIPEQPDMDAVFSSIIDNVVLVKDGSGKTYIPSYGINNIGNLNSLLGYQVYMSAAAELNITGSKIDVANTTIDLPEGWNIISYIKDSEMNIETALEQLTDNGNLLLAKDNAGITYIPIYGINNIVNMKPGQGYYIYIINSDSFKYPN